MFGFLKGLFQTDAGKSGGSGKGKARGKAAGGSARDQALAQIRANQDRVVTPERAELIRRAMEVRRAKQKILMDLSDEQRQKLAVMAVRAFLNEGKDDKT